MPQWDISTRDGFAVRSQDVAEATLENPRILQVIETVKAGLKAKRQVIEGTAIRIMTGAPIPSGADCVVRFEDTDEYERRQPDLKITPKIGIRYEEKAGANIRKAGGDIPGQSLLVPVGKPSGRVKMLFWLPRERLR